MDEELEKEIFASAPVLFRVRDGQRSLLNYGIECGNGWFGIIKELSIQLEQLICSEMKSAPIEDYPYAVQIKQKYGGLSFYLDYPVIHFYDECQNMISKYDSKARDICEDCGDKSEVCTTGWINYLCKECAKDRAYMEIKQ